MKKRKKYIPKTIRIPKIVMQHNDFEQVDRLMMMIENESVLESGGDIVMFAQSGEVYQVAPALNTWCDYWQEIAKVHDESMNDIALRILINKINHNMPVTKSLIREAKEVVDKQRAYFMKTDHNTISRKAIELQMTL